MLVIPRKKSRMSRPAENMKAPRRPEMVEAWLTSPLAKDRFFWNLSRTLQTELDGISSPATYSKREILFTEGQLALGVFVISAGSVKLSAASADGKVMIMRVAGPREIVGLPGAISGKNYEMTAEALEPVKASFIPRKPFRAFVRAHGEVGLRVAEILSQIYQTTYREVRYLGLSGSAEAKLARFLVDLVSDGRDDHVRVRAALPLTHEEIAAVVGLSRETVTRLFTDLKRKRLVDVQGSTLLIPDARALRSLIA
jgi:CRP/FNR family transcriptional regulator, cyclic AMP receptor protein